MTPLITPVEGGQASSATQIPAVDDGRSATMLERIVRVIAERAGTPAWEEHEATARAALQAIREPDAEMVCAGLDHLPYMQTTPSHVRTAFTAMIDAILSEGAGE